MKRSKRKDVVEFVLEAIFWTPLIYGPVASEVGWNSTIFCLFVGIAMVALIVDYLMFYPILRSKSNLK